MVLEEQGAIERAGIRFQVAIFEEALARRPDDCESLRYLAHAYAVLGRYADGLDADRRLATILPRDARVRYNLACSLALTGRVDEAFASLDEAVRLGFSDLVLARKDQDLDTLRSDPRWPAFEQSLARRGGRKT